MLTIGRHKSGYAIYDGEKIVRWNFRSYSNADMGIQAYERSLVKTARRKRPCMTCGEDFMSEGIGNRMCYHCKNRGY